MANGPVTAEHTYWEPKVAHRPDGRTQDLDMQAHGNADSWSRPTSALITPDLPTRGAASHMGEPEEIGDQMDALDPCTYARIIVNESKSCRHVRNSGLTCQKHKSAYRRPSEARSQMDASDACTYALSIVNDSRTPENESEHVRKGGNSLTHLIEAQKYAQRSYRL